MERGKIAIRVAVLAAVCVLLADYLLKAAQACRVNRGLFMIDQQTGTSWCVSYQTLGGSLLLVGLLLIFVGALLTFSKGE
ncbi:MULTISPECIES: hypothetical protein [unclassified Cupriavidus]|uniref:hypothetical protein n=1 Tax=unclassified Cupriavidus TaxID=2640874 RepID=UPI001C006B7D|nr:MULTISPECIES: hypothetical protein [unclassified Cupriavidus]MCA3187162.1 hypothetical protein [Cupriavidus sp.]MCA3189220.1 hypothetical protein [Cupriavidus sp.]MCA3195300.1 hypothetical protein [Cupriavidus sp.]MCA3200855.1 hypothetical protein [Cupriavidus sp.]MCA3230947.1 hypothetical protein [Cupriavidus sp.]